MANPFVKGWKYLMAAFGAKIDEKADPKIQIQQAIEEAQRQHQQLTQQAAAVIGNQRQLEMKLARQMTEVEKLQGSARQALVLADQKRAAGDEAEAQAYEQTAQAFATQLVVGRAVDGGPQGPARPGPAGRRAGQEGRRDQRDAPCRASSPSARSCSASSSRPRCRSRSPRACSRCRSCRRRAPARRWPRSARRSRRRYANALGSAELASSSVEGRMLEVQNSTLDMAGASRLDQIRASLAGNQLAGPPAAGSPQLSKGTPAADKDAQGTTGRGRTTG